MKKFLREPLLHFLILGAALFAAFSLFDEGDAPGGKQIVLSAGKIRHMAEVFQRTWQRPPTKEELDGLITDYIREEAAYREGMAMGLDRDDIVIRRRIRQKVDFFAESLVNQVEPTEEDLQAYLAAHPDTFRTEPRVTFNQIFFDPMERGDTLESDVLNLKIALNGGSSVDAREQGDATMLEHHHAGVSIRDVANQFGGEFAEALAQMPPGQWQGPVKSAYGVHLCYIVERRDGQLQGFNDVRDAVRREWENNRRNDMIEQFYRGLLEQYQIVIEWPEAGATENEL